MKFRRRVVVVAVAALAMIAIFVLLPVINRTEPTSEFPPVQFERPNLTSTSLPMVSPPGAIESDANTADLAAETPELETPPELIEIKINQKQNPLVFGDGIVITDATEFFVPLVAFDTVDLDERTGPFQGNARGNPNEMNRGDNGAWARIQFVVAADGSVSDARIDAASDGDFGEVGLDAIRNWRFTDGIAAKKSVRTWVVRPFPLREDQ